MKEYTMTYLRLQIRRDTLKRSVVKIKHTLMSLHKSKKDINKSQLNCCENINRYMYHCILLNLYCSGQHSDQLSEAVATFIVV